MKGEKKIIAGGARHQGARGWRPRCCPDSVKGAMHRQMAEPGSAD